MLRAGVVGTGWWAEIEHLPGLRSRSDVEVRAICGRNPERLKTIADKFAIPNRFTDWREMIEKGDLDLIVIVTPNVLHHPIAMAALKAKMHLICEKPLAMNAAQAHEMAALAAANQRKTLTFFTHRALAAAAQMKRLVSEGFLGKPLHASAVYFSASHLKEGKPASWRMRRSEAGTGVLGDIGSHVIDLVRWWLGDFARVSAQWQTVTRERPGGAVDGDESVAFLSQLKSGVPCTIQASKLVAGRGNFQRVELFGDRASLIYEAEPGIDADWIGRLWSGHADSVGLTKMELHNTQGLETQQGGRVEAWRRLTEPFFAAIQNGGSVSPDFADGAAVQEVLDAVATSAEQKRWIEISAAAAP
jgi:predicted dehydrogenase